jgi:hypothetical protein
MQDPPAGGHDATPVKRIYFSREEVEAKLGRVQMSQHFQQPALYSTVGEGPHCLENPDHRNPSPDCRRAIRTQQSLFAAMLRSIYLAF